MATALSREEALIQRELLRKTDELFQLEQLRNGWPMPGYEAAKLSAMELERIQILNAPWFKEAEQFARRCEEMRAEQERLARYTLPYTPKPDARRAASVARLEGLVEDLVAEVRELRADVERHQQPTLLSRMQQIVAVVAALHAIFNTVRDCMAD